MEWSKLKNIIILMLAAVNVMLLVLVLSRQWESRSYSENAREDAVAILWETGRIRVERDALPDEMDLPVLTVTRDPELELRQAEALLGALSGEPSSMRYEGERGTAQFYANGGFSAELEAGACPIGDKAPAAYAVDLLAGMEFEAQVLEVREQGESTFVTVQQLWQGEPVFDCTATLIFQEAELRRIQEDVSRRLVGEPQSGGEERTYTVATMLMRFMDYVISNGRVCNEIDAFDPGYILESQSEPARLVPAWRVETDQGDYYWNAVTGEIRTAS